MYLSRCTRCLGSKNKKGILTAKEKFLRHNAKALSLKAKILNWLKKPEDHLQPVFQKAHAFR